MEIRTAKDRPRHSAAWIGLLVALGVRLLQAGGLLVSGTAGMSLLGADLTALSFGSLFFLINLVGLGLETGLADHDPQLGLELDLAVEPRRAPDRLSVGRQRCAQLDEKQREIRYLRLLQLLAFVEIVPQAEKLSRHDRRQPMGLGRIHQLGGRHRVIEQLALDADLDDIATLARVALDEMRRTGEVSLRPGIFSGRDGRETEGEILQAMNDAMSGRTTFIVAHRLSTLRRWENVSKPARPW